MAKQGFLIDISRDRLKILLDGETTSIGRSTSNTIRIDSKHCSRKHCRIDCAGEAYLLTSQHSSSGIRVNGFYVRERELQSGDEIDIAGRSFIFNFEDRPEVWSSADLPAPLPQENPVTTTPAGLSRMLSGRRQDMPKVTYWTLFLTGVRSAVIMILVLMAGMFVFHIGVRQGWLELRGDMTMDNIWKWMCYGLFVGLGLQLTWGVLSLLLKRPGKNKPKVVKRISKATKQ